MKPTILPLVICFLGLLPNSFQPAHAAMRHDTKIRAGLPPYDVVAGIMRTYQEKTPDSIALSDVRQTPSFTWLADCDPRMQPDLILKNFHNRLLNIQNLGGQLNPVLGAVDFGVRQLRSPVLLITGIPDSPALQLLADGTGQEISAATAQELLALRHLLPEGAEKANDGKPAATSIRAMAEKNVDLQVDIAMKRYGDRITTGRLVIIGSLLDFTGDYGNGEGRLIIININGETADAALRQHPVLVKLSPEQRLAVGRKAGPASRQKTGPAGKE